MRLVTIFALSSCLASLIPKIALSAPYAKVLPGTSIDAIQSALDMIGSRGGGSLVLVQGTYLGAARGPLLSLSSNTILRCENGAVIKNTASHGGVLKFAGVSRSGVEGCNLIASNGSPVQPVDSRSGRTVEVSGGSSEIRIANNTISGYEFAGVLIDGGSRLTITNNTFRDGTDTSALTTSPLSSDINIWGTMTNSSVVGNRMLSRNDIGFICGPQTAPDSTCAGNSLISNEIANKYIYGIALYGNTRVASQSVVGNIVRNNRIYNIHSRNAGFGNNSGEAIYLVGADDNIIEQNRAWNTMQGRLGLVLPLGAISVSNGLRNSVRSNRVAHSDWGCFHIVGGSAPEGEVTIIESNTCENASRFGFWNERSDRTQFIRNSARDLGKGHPDGTCFKITDSASVSLRQNQCSGGLDFGYFIDSASPDAELLENRAERNGVAGFLIVGSPTTLEDNVARNNNGPGFVFGAENGTVYAGGNSAVDDRGRAARQTYGYLEKNTSSLLALKGNRGRGNLITLWKIGTSHVASERNQGLPEKDFKPEVPGRQNP